MAATNRYRVQPFVWNQLQFNLAQPPQLRNLISSAQSTNLPSPFIVNKKNASPVRMSIVKQEELELAMRLARRDVRMMKHEKRSTSAQAQDREKDSENGLSGPVGQRTERLCQSSTAARLAQVEKIRQQQPIWPRSKGRGSSVSRRRPPPPPQSSMPVRHRDLPLRSNSPPVRDTDYWQPNRIKTLGAGTTSDLHLEEMKHLREEIAGYAKQLAELQLKVTSHEALPIRPKLTTPKQTWDSTPVNGPSGMPPPPARLPLRPYRMRKALGLKERSYDHATLASRSRRQSSASQPVAQPVRVIDDDEVKSAQRRHLLTEILEVLCDERLHAQKATNSNGTAQLSVNALLGNRTSLDRSQSPVIVVRDPNLPTPDEIALRLERLQLETDRIRLRWQDAMRFESVEDDSTRATSVSPNDDLTPHCMVTPASDRHALRFTNLKTSSLSSLNQTDVPKKQDTVHVVVGVTNEELASIQRGRAKFYEYLTDSGVMRDGCQPWSLMDNVTEHVLEELLEDVLVDMDNATSELVAQILANEMMDSGAEPLTAATEEASQAELESLHDDDMSEHVNGHENYSRCSFASEVTLPDQENQRTLGVVLLDAADLLEELSVVVPHSVESPDYKNKSEDYSSFSESVSLRGHSTSQSSFRSSQQNDSVKENNSFL